jgi:hypothetical protein
MVVTLIPYVMFLITPGGDWYANTVVVEKQAVLDILNDDAEEGRCWAPSNNRDGFGRCNVAPRLTHPAGVRLRHTATCAKCHAGA